MGGFSLNSCVIFNILDSGPVSEIPDEGLFFVDKEMEEMRATGMIHTCNYIYTLQMYEMLQRNFFFVFHLAEIILTEPVPEMLVFILLIGIPLTSNHGKFQKSFNDQGKIIKNGVYSTSFA